MSRPPAGPSSSLLLQAGYDEVELAANVSKQHGLGVVLVAPSDYRWNHHDLVATAAERFFELAGYMPDVDANWYSGSKRRPGDAELSLNWALRQIKLGTPTVTTDGGFVAAHRSDQLREALDRALAIQDAVGVRVRCMLAIDYLWLKERSAELIDELYSRDIEVALAVGHRDDPFGRQSTVRGLIDVLRLGTVSLHRTDLSALGALAMGAPTAAIGTRTSLRHVYTSSGGGRAASEWPSVIVGRTMAYRTQDRVNDFIMAFEDDALWRCFCDQCEGLRLDHALRPMRTAAITAHNYNVTAMLTQDVLGSSSPLDTWFSKCKVAQSYILQVADETGIPWNPPDFLGGWIANEPSRVGV